MPATTLQGGKEGQGNPYYHTLQFPGTLRLKPSAVVRLAHDSSQLPTASVSRWGATTW